MEQIPKLTDLEIVIMGVLWGQGQDMTIQEISDCLEDGKVSPPSVAQAMKRLLKKKAVIVTGSRLVSNVYARVFRPCFEQEAFVGAEIERLEQKMSVKKQIGMFGIAAAILKGDTSEQISETELDELQAIIDQKKSKLQERGE